MSEHAIQNEIRLGISGKATMFRNNVGTAYVGEVYRPNGIQSVTVSPADVVIRNARILHAGLCEGSSDLIGWRSLIITPDMVGERIAVFAALEVKSKTGRATAGQKNFCDRVIQAGGLAGIVKSLDDAKKALAID
jgi:hypothetical protein